MRFIQHDHVADDLIDAVAWIVAQGQARLGLRVDGEAGMAR
jgi:hypothetical protein